MRYFGAAGIMGDGEIFRYFGALGSRGSGIMSISRSVGSKSV